MENLVCSMQNTGNHDFKTCLIFYLKMFKLEMISKIHRQSENAGETLWFSAFFIFYFIKVYSKLFLNVGY